MAKKIGILTFHFPINYGAVLQAFALSKACQLMGGDVEVVNYFSTNQERANNIFLDKQRGCLKSMLYVLLVLPYWQRLWRKKHRFQDFIKNHINISPRFKNLEELELGLGPKDIYLTGSDQVFNPVSDGNIKVYYQSFHNKRIGIKAAYAPSFGISSFSEDLSNKIRPLLCDFDYLSCREDDGAAYISSLTGNNTPVVLDPVFLLSASEWSKCAIKDVQSNYQDESYIFVYDLNGRNNLISIANKIGQKKNLPIICLTTKKYNVSRYRVDEIIMDAGPLEFISLIRDADTVVTDSFHGTAFSILFNKKFVTYNALPRASVRITSMLNKLNLQKHFVEDIHISSDELCSIREIDNSYQDELHRLIKISKDYLFKCIK